MKCIIFKINNWIWGENFEGVINWGSKVINSNIILGFKLFIKKFFFIYVVVDWIDEFVV